MTTLSAEQIAKDFGIELTGLTGTGITGTDRLEDAKAGSLTWAKACDESMIVHLAGVVVVLPAARTPAEDPILGELAKRNTLLLLNPDLNPRLVFARILARYFSHLEVQIPPGVDPTARVDPSAKIGRNVTISGFCFIGPDVEIGDDTVLHPGVVVHSRSIIGRNCIINANVVIGNRGFGFVREENGSLVHFPHIGRVVIEEDVEIQANTTIDRTALGETRIGRGTKVDNLCHIGHGAQIGPHCLITACTEIGARVVVEEGAWIGPNSCSIENVTIGKGSYVGIGSTVTKSVPAGAVFAGSPAEPIEDLKDARAVLKGLVTQKRAP